MKLPYDPKLDTRKLSQIFNNTSASYKFYWFLGILDEIEKDKCEIIKTELFTKMISIPWYTVNYFKLSFGSQDMIHQNARRIQEILNIPVSYSKHRIEELILKSQDEELNRLIWHFNKNVPYKFLSPWMGALSEKEIMNKSESELINTLYILRDDRILVREEWANYLKRNIRFMRDFTYWNLLHFIQRRNPGTPDIADKIIKPAKRESLTKYRKSYWNIYLDQHHSTRCIFTGEVLDGDNYDLDHFIPHSFMPANQIWNLVPISSSFNSSKSNKVPNLNIYFENFFQLQKDAYSFLEKKLNHSKFKNFKEEFLYIYPELYSSNDFEFKRYKETIEPLCNVALNNGFQILN